MIDGSDNFGTRYIINDTCCRFNKIHIYGAIFQFEGQLSVFNYQGGPTYKDFHNELKNENNLEDTCSSTGVLGLLPGIIGTLQAIEAIKIILGYKTILSGVIFKYNASKLSFQKFKIINTKFTLSQQNKQYKKTFLETKKFIIEEFNILQFQNFLKKNNSRYTLIDVRNSKEYKQFHLDNSLNIPLKEILKQQNTSVYQYNKICFVYCSLDSRSILASKLLAQQGLHIIRIQGGLNAWTNIIGK